MSDINAYFLNVFSTWEDRSLSSLLEDGCKSNISFFNYEIGFHMKQFRRAKIGDEIVYSIDNMRISRGNIEFIKFKAFRPIFVDHGSFKVFLTYIGSKFNFDYHWQKRMEDIHIKAINNKRWLFAVAINTSTTVVYNDNVSYIRDKISRIELAEQNLEQMYSCGYAG